MCKTVDLSLILRTNNRRRRLLLKVTVACVCAHAPSSIHTHSPEQTDRGHALAPPLPASYVQGIQSVGLTLLNDSAVFWWKLPLGEESTLFFYICVCKGPLGYSELKEACPCLWNERAFSSAFQLVLLVGSPLPISILLTSTKGSPCVCVCVYKCARVCASVHIHSWRLDIDVGCLPQLLCLIF